MKRHAGGGTPMNEERRFATEPLSRRTGAFQGKTGLLALGLMLSSGGVASAQPPQPQQPQEWAAKLFGPPANLTHDFGTVPRGAQLYHDFVMTNI